MIVRALVVGGALVAAVVLETALFPALSLLGYRPDLLLLLVLGLALRDGPLTGARVGAAAGIIGDLLVSQSPVGLFLLTYAVVGYAAGVARPYLAPDSVTAPVLLAFGSAAVATGAYGLFTSLLGDERTTAASLVEASLMVGLYTTLLAPVAFWVVGEVVERFPLRGQAVAG